MIDDIIKLSQHFLTIKNRPYQRYFLTSDFKKHRCLLLLGQRGIGKTTTLIQYLLKQSDGDVLDPRILYIQTDHFLLRDASLYDIAEQFQILGGEYIVFDEIHKYSNWSQELKSIYDTFPKLNILASGSSALEVHKGTHDLSRRALVYHLSGLSFREFLELKCDLSLAHYSLNDIINNHEKIANAIISQLADKKLNVIPLFRNYFNYGFYPYFFEINDVNSFWLTLEQNIHVTIESDLATIYPQLTGHSIKKIIQLLSFIAGSVPFIPNWNKIKEIVNVADPRTLKSYCKYLEDACLIQIINKYSSNMRNNITSEKIYLNNPNQIQALSTGNGNKGNLRETFFLNMLTLSYQIDLAANGDFIIDGKYTFEIGGRNKKNTQINNIKNAYLANDDIETGIRNKIPLWLFGFLY